MMVYAYVHGIKQFRENELSIQKSVFKRLRVEHCRRVQKHKILVNCLFERVCKKQNGRYQGVNINIMEFLNI